MTLSETDGQGHSHVPAQFAKLAPFALRAGVVTTGRHQLYRLHKHMRFLLVTNDTSPRSVDEILNAFSDVPVVRAFTTDDIARLFNLRNTKVVGFRKSSLADSLLRILKPYRTR